MRRTVKLVLLTWLVPNSAHISSQFSQWSVCHGRSSLALLTKLGNISLCDITEGREWVDGEGRLTFESSLHACQSVVGFDVVADKTVNLQ